MKQALLLPIRPPFAAALKYMDAVSQRAVLLLLLPHANHAMEVRRGGRWLCSAAAADSATALRCGPTPLRLTKEGYTCYVPQLSSIYIIPGRRDAIRLRSVKPM